MLKRDLDGGGSESDQDNPPRRATTSQIAGRRILDAKRRQARRPQGNTQLPSSQNFGNAHANTNGTQQTNGFSFGSQSFGATQNPGSSATQGSTQSASFPPFSNIAASNTGFNFSGGSNIPNNPFATGMTNTQVPTQSGGFQGSLFNFPPSTTSSITATPAEDEDRRKKKAEQDSVKDGAPMWANGVNPFLSNAPEQAQQSTANGLGGFTPSQPLFNSFPSTQTTSPVANMFGSAQSQQSKSSQPTANPFSNAPSFAPTSNVLPASSSPQSSLNIFGASQSQQPVSDQSANPFGASQPTFTFGAAPSQQSTLNRPDNSSESQHSKPSQLTASQSTSGVFSSLQPQQTQPLSNIFGNNSSNNPQATSPTRNEGDSMSTTPDASPSAPQHMKQASPSAFSFLNTPASAPSQNGTCGLFGRVSQPTTETAASVGDQGSNQNAPSGGGSLFGRISQPSDNGDQSSRNDPPAVNASAEAPKSVFAGFGQPSASTSNINTSGSDAPKSISTGFGQPAANSLGPSDNQPKSSESEAPKNTFTGFGQSPAKTNQAFSGDQLSTSGSGVETPKSTLPKSMFPGFGLKRAAESDQSAIKEGSPSTKPLFAQSQSASNKSNESNIFAGFGQSSMPPSAFTASEPAIKSSAPISKTPPLSSQGVSGSMIPHQRQPAPNHQAQTKRKPGAPPAPPSDFNDFEKQQLITSYRLKSFDTGFKNFLRSDTTEDIKAALDYYQTRRDAITDGVNRPSIDAPGSKRKNVSGEESPITKKARFDTAETQSPLNLQQASGEQSNSRPSSSQQSTSQSGPELSASRSSFDQRLPSQSGFESSTSRPSFQQHLSNQPSAPKSTSPSKKRKAEVQITKDDPEDPYDDTEPSQIEAPVSYPSLSQSSTSDTSSIFKSIVNDAHDRPAPASSSSTPAKASTNLFSFKPSAAPSSSTPAQAPAGNLFSPFKASAAPASSTPTHAPATNIFSPFKPSAELSSKSANTPAANPFSLSKPASSFGTTNTSGNTDSTAKTPDENPPASVPKTTIKPPTFGSGTPVNYMSQFQQMSKTQEQSEKSKRKADDLDSDEDEAEWERQYEEEQRAKKQKINEIAKGKKYILGRGFVSSEDDAKKSLFLDPDEGGSDRDSRASSVSVLEQPQKPLTNGMTNIFGHLSDVGSGAEGSKTGDADDEDTASENSRGEEETTDTSGEAEEIEKLQPDAPTNAFSAVNAKFATEAETNIQDESSKSRSLFDRMEKDKDGNLVKDTPAAEKKVGNPSAFGASGSSSSNPFAFGALGANSSNPLKTSSSSLFTASTPVSKPDNLSNADSSPGDHSWKAGSPIKFGGDLSKPEVEITSPSPGKPALGALFGSPQTNPSANSANKPVFNPFQPKAPAAAPEVGFGFAPKSTGSLAPPTAMSNNTSRATSPGASSNAGSVSESGADNEEEQHEQFDLTAGGPGEENEENIFEAKGKVMEYNAEEKKWKSKGVGPLRVLKHRQSGKTRILMRHDPAGKIVLNAGLLSKFEYKHETPKGVRFTAPTEKGKLAQHLFRTAKDEDAVTLAKILEENKTV